jgi:tRNA (cmo5U34)-methyltransferase
MNPFLKQQFDQVAKEYDQQRRQLIPCFDDFYGMAAYWVKTSEDEPRVLDLGAGTGLFSGFVQQKYPKAAFTLVDLSEEMLKAAKSRFEDYSNVKYIVADYIAYPLEERYDMVISSLSIHHLTDADKKRIFQKVFSLLKDGGVFVNADQAAGRTPYFDERFKELWEDEIRKSDLSSEAIASAIERRKLDCNASVSDQLSWLQEAGFADVDCVYKYHEFAVFYARKA